MPSAWKWKVWLLMGLTVLSAYLLLPTLLGLQGQREEAEVSGKTLPWYMHLLPDKGLNLGLDLRGGIYLEFEVELDRAIANKIDLIVDDLDRSLKKENVAITSIRQDAAVRTIVMEAGDADALAAASAFVQKYYNDTLTEISPGTFGLSKPYADYLDDQIVKQALEKVRNRIDRYGVAEPSIHRLGSNRIAVELPGIQDPDRAIALIKKAGQLEFKIVNDTKSLSELAGFIAEARKTLNLADDSYSTETAQTLTKVLAPKLPADTEIAFETKFDPVAKKVVGGTPYLLNRKAEVTGEMLKNAQVNVDNNEPYVSLTFDAQGAQLFGEATTKHVGKQLAILLDGVVNSAPVVREPILGGQAQITMGYGSYEGLRKECEDLVLVLQEGALPAQLTEATKTVVGPSLGADSIRKGVMATAVSALVVVLFMLFYYKASGILANAALLLNLLFILAALALFQATLTLPGIAGIVLTLGMAVDANVLIFERMKEEIRAGKTPKAVVSAGYGNAMRTIIDSNVTTLLSGFVLYQFGTGPIKGFAVTLIIGLIISMYTACTCTRLVYDYFLTQKKITRISL